MTGEERFTAVDRTKLTFFQLNDIYECNSCLEIKHNLAQAGDYSVKGTHCPPPTHPPPTTYKIRNSQGRKWVAIKVSAAKLEILRQSIS